MLNNKPFFLAGGLLLAGFLCLVAVGCNGGQGAVTGTVTLDGTPVPGCQLEFFSLEKGASGSATTNAKGVYRASMSLDNKYLAPGEYRVQIKGPADMKKANGMAGDITPEDVSLPKKYQGDDSELTVTVKPGGNTLDFKLESE